MRSSTTASGSSAGGTSTRSACSRAAAMTGPIASGDHGSPTSVPGRSVENPPLADLQELWPEGEGVTDHAQHGGDSDQRIQSLGSATRLFPGGSICPVRV